MARPRTCSWSSLPVLDLRTGFPRAVGASCPATFHPSARPPECLEPSRGALTETDFIMRRFENYSVIVTGARSGIGLATAKRFAAEGASVTMVARSADALNAAAKSIDGRVQAVPADISDPEAVAKVVKAAVDAYGKVDGLVNNAGVAKTGMIDALEFEDWKTQIDVNLTGTYLMTRAAWDELKKTGGSIVNVSSVSGIGGDWGMFAYNAAKGGVTNLTRALALDAARSGIRVNAVNPSLTRTDMADGVVSDDGLKAKFMERMPLGRPGEPEDVASVIAFLASTDAAFVNGVNLPVDGGLSASNGQPPQA